MNKYNITTDKVVAAVAIFVNDYVQIKNIVSLASLVPFIPSIIKLPLVVGFDVASNYCDFEEKECKDNNEAITHVALDTAIYLISASLSPALVIGLNLAGMASVKSFPEVSFAPITDSIYKLVEFVSDYSKGEYTDTAIEALEVEFSGESEVISE